MTHIHPMTKTIRTNPLKSTRATRVKSCQKVSAKRGPSPRAFIHLGSDDWGPDADSEPEGSGQGGPAPATAPIRKPTSTGGSKTESHPQKGAQKGAQKGVQKGVQKGARVHVPTSTPPTPVRVRAPKFVGTPDISAKNLPSRGPQVWKWINTRVLKFCQLPLTTQAKILKRGAEFCSPITVGVIIKFSKYATIYPETKRLIASVVRSQLSVFDATERGILQTKLFISLDPIPE